MYLKAKFFKYQFKNRDLIFDYFGLYSYNTECMNKLKTLIYPVGKYNPKYTKYIGWSFISNTIASTQHALSVHNMLLAIDSDTTEIARTMNYIGKDIIGQIGSLGYMAKMAKKADQKPTRFLNYAHVAQQSSYLAICSTPLLSSEYFLLLAGSANIMSNISFAGFGAINAKCISNLAEDNNIGEIYAKITIINTLGSSLGMLIGLFITSLYPDNNCRMLFIPILGILRVYTFNKAIEGIL